jgi:hypothetical protein
MHGMRARVLRSVLIAAVLTGAVVGLLLLRSDGAETPQQPQATVGQALAGFVADRFGAMYVGTCPRKFPEDGDVPRGMCSARRSGADGRVLYRVGHPFSEWAGEATFVRDASGSWHVASFEEYPPSAAELALAPRGPGLQGDGVGRRGYLRSTLRTSRTRQDREPPTGSTRLDRRPAVRRGQSVCPL